MFLSRSKSIVGLDIGSATIKLVELKEKKGGQFLLQRIGVEPLSPEAIVDGSIMDSSLVVDAIQKLNDQTGVKSANFATSVSGHSVIIKKIELPQMAPDELAESIQWARRHREAAVDLSHFAWSRVAELTHDAYRACVETHQD